MLKRLLLAIVASQLVLGGFAALVAIDLGSEFLKVSLIKPGRIPITIVTNEMSKRKTPALVGIVNGERLVGEEAASVTARYPEAIVARARDLLGKTVDDPTVKHMLESHILPYEVVEHPTRKTAAIKVGDTVYAAEEIVASLFQYAKSIAEQQAGSLILDAVLTVPAYYSQFQRQALVDAASLAGLSVMGLINSHSAAALQYGIERDFTNNTQTVILYDMGSSGVEVALVKFSTFNIKEGGKTKTYNQFEVKDVDWDHTLGGNDLDILLAKHFAKQFAEKYKTADVTTVPKAMARLRKQVRRTKEVLSANSGAPFSVEELHDGHDFSSSIKREEFEQMAGDFFERAAAPLRRIVDRHHLRGSELAAVELLGGGTRVPKLQAALSAVLGGRALDRHLDSDEASVLGAALFAANLSTSFRLKKFGMADGAMYGVAFKADGVKFSPTIPAAADASSGSEASDGDDSETGFETSADAAKALLPYMKKLPSKRAVTYNNVTSDGFSFTLSYNASTPHGLPPGLSDAVLGRWEVSGIADVIAKYNFSGKLKVRFEADHGGIVKFDKAECSVEYEVMEEKIVTEKVAVEANATSADNSTEAAPDVDAADGGNATNGTEAKNATKTVVKTIMAPKIKFAKVVLNVTGGYKMQPLTADDFAASQKVLKAWTDAEKVKRETARARNDLESYIIAMRDKMDSDELIAAVTTEEQRAAFSAQLVDMEDWLYGDGDEEGAKAFKDKLAELKKVGDPMVRRSDEHQRRPETVSVLRDSVDLKKKVVKAWPDMKPWINETERETVAAKIEEFEQWLEAKVSEQEQQPAHEEPAFTVREALLAHDSMERVYNRANNKRKPKPPPEPVATANATANGTANATADGTSEGGAGGGDDEGAGKEKASSSSSSEDAGGSSSKGSSSEGSSKGGKDSSQPGGKSGQQGSSKGKGRQKKSFSWGAGKGKGGKGKGGQKEEL